MKIIPAIDIIDGRCVRLSKGDYSTKKIYDEHPLEVAKAFEGAGITYLHLVDLDGAKEKSPQNLKTLESICSSTSLKVDVGGGLSKTTHIDSIFSAGANQFTAGSIAVNDAALTRDWIKKYGAEKIILGADCKNKMIVTAAWSTETQLPVTEFIKDYMQYGIKYSICTDVAKDGMLSGPAEELYVEILAATGIKLIASGGIASIADVEKMKTIGCDGCIIGKAYYEGRISLKQLTSLC